MSEVVDVVDGGRGVSEATGAGEVFDEGGFDVNSPSATSLAFSLKTR